MKIIHLSDLHIGKKLREISLAEDQHYILGKILEIISQEQPDCVIIAGDVYDRSAPPAEAVRRFRHRSCRNGTPGNDNQRQPRFPGEDSFRQPYHGEARRVFFPGIQRKSHSRNSGGRLRSGGLLAHHHHRAGARPGPHRHRGSGAEAAAGRHPHRKN